MEFKKLIIIMSVAITIIMVCFLGVSYAYYSLSSASTNFSTTVKDRDVSVSYQQSEYISVTTGVPISDSAAATKAGSSKFNVVADATKFSGYDVAIEVSVVDITIDDALKVNDFKIQLLENGSVVKTVTGSNIGNNSKVVMKDLSLINVGTNYNYELRVWISDTGVSQNQLMGKGFSGRIQIASSIRN